MLTEKTTEFQRGEIYYCDFARIGGSVQEGTRPALIIQNNIGNKYSKTLIVAPITTIIKKPNQPTHLLLGKRFGLPEESMLMLEQISTVDKKEHIREYIGFIDDRDVMKKVDKMIMLSLGIKEDKKSFESELLENLQLHQDNRLYVCLCHRCRQIFCDNGYDVGQVMYEEKTKDTCDWCGVNKGFDCVIKSKEATTNGSK